MSEFTELDITQRMIQAGRHAANLPDATLARIYVAMRAAERGWDGDKGEAERAGTTGPTLGSLSGRPTARSDFRYTD